IRVKPRTGYQSSSLSEMSYDLVTLYHCDIWHGRCIKSRASGYQQPTLAQSRRCLMFRVLSTTLLRLLRLEKSTGNPAARSAPRPTRKPRRFRPEIECLERRDTPSITYHGGALLPNVEVQPMFYGLDWATNTTNLGQALQLS